MTFEMGKSMEMRIIRAIRQRIEKLDGERGAGAAAPDAEREWPRDLPHYALDVALAVALRHVRRARTQWQVLAAVADLLDEHLGVEAFAVLDTSCEPPRIRAQRGMSGTQLLALLAYPPGGAPGIIAWCPLGVGPHTLGSLAVSSLRPDKEKLDHFDHALLAALGPQTAMALRVCEDLAARPTSRPPRMMAPVATPEMADQEPESA
jgi:hypothetical protein